MRLCLTFSCGYLLDNAPLYMKFKQKRRKTVSLNLFKILSNTSRIFKVLILYENCKMTLFGYNEEESVIVVDNKQLLYQF